MAQQRQSGSERYGIRTQGYTLNSSSSLPTSLTGGTADHVSLGIRVPSKQGLRNRRFGGRAEKNSGNWRKISIGFVALMLAVIGFFSVFGYYYYLSRDKEVSSIQMTSKRWGGSDLNRFDGQDDGLKDDSDFLTNVTRTPYKVLNFGHESGLHGRDSRYWDRDDRRRDGEYSGGASELANDDVHVKESGKEQSDGTKRMIQGSQVSDSRGVGLYNEAGRNELKLYEAKYEASLKNVGQLAQENSFRTKLSDGTDLGLQNNDGDSDDEYYDAIDFHDPRMTDYDTGNENENQNNVAKGQDDDTGGSSAKINRATRETNTDEDLEDSNEALTIPEEEASRSADNAKTNSRHKAVRKGRSTKRFPSDMRKAPKRRKFTSSACEMKFLNSTALLVEPVESQKFSRFSLQYTDVEERPRWQEKWEPRFAGHQSLEEREESFYARDQKVNCGFVKGPQGYASTGFDISEDDKQFMLSCHTAVSSCIFGNSDNLRTPTSRTVTLLSKKNVCFVMFMDENTLQTLSSEGHKPDRSGFIGLWKIVVVKNLPYADMRRVGKIPKFLTHRLFPSARYSIWLDSKLRLQNDPLLILEYFLWRKGYEYAISNHYDRHCVWEEVAQNKRLNKFNHTVIDEQFQFYQADGLQRFNASDPNKLLPSNVPEGSFIVRAHTPMSNLFSCLWFNEVERFTPRDQLSFAYVYHKLRRMNPEKPFRLNMFKDCERRAMAKLFRHRSEKKWNLPLEAIG